MKKLLALLLCMVLVLGLTACSFHTHDFGEGKIIQETSCRREGKKEFTCSCGETYTEEIEALAHTFRTPDCTKSESCQVCRYVNSPALGHDYDGGVCGRCGDSMPDTHGLMEGAWYFFDERVDGLLIVEFRDDNTYRAEYYGGAVLCDENTDYSDESMKGMQYIRFDEEIYAATGWIHTTDEGAYSVSENQITMNVYLYDQQVGKYGDHEVILEQTEENRLQIVHSDIGEPELGFYGYWLDDIWTWTWNFIQS